MSDLQPERNFKQRALGWVTNLFVWGFAAWAVWSIGTALDDAPEWGRGLIVGVGIALFWLWSIMKGLDKQREETRALKVWIDQRLDRIHADLRQSARLRHQEQLEALERFIRPDQ